MSGVLAANAANNARARAARRRRWRPARAAAWALLEPYVAPGARVAVVGAGNGHDLPLGRLASVAARLDLVDVDGAAVRQARRRLVRGRGRIGVHVEDLTGGGADAAVAAALSGGAAPALAIPRRPVGAGGYDVVIADLVLTQLLYPALRRTGLDGAHIDAMLLRDGQPLIDGVVARLHAAAPEGIVVVLHDLLGWWDGHPQPFALDDVLELAAAGDAPGALRLARTGSLPYGCDPWLATRRAGARVVETRMWRWPFAPGADYLVCGLVTRR
jgi:hypothetical protein